MMRVVRQILVMLGLTLACAVSGPLDPIWGKQTCGHCKMLVSDKSFAAQLLTHEDERLFFDDIGCMVEYLEERGSRARGLWVYEDNGWLDARSARYRTGAPSPMDYGFLPDREASLDFAGLRKAIAERKEAGSR